MLLPVRVRPLLLLSLLLGPACEEGAPRKRRIEAMEERVADLEARLGELERRTPAGSEAPAIRPPGPVAAPEPVVIEVVADGLTLDGVRVEPASLAEQLRERVSKAGGAGLTLAVRAATDIPHARVFAVLDLAADAGITRISMTPAISQPPPTP
jgi:biopolymer transport protein ExbD